MRLIPLSEVIIPPDRQRQEFDAEKLVSLSNSIQSSTGLKQPIVVRASTEGPVLVAGERRIRAISDIFALGGTYVFERQPVPDGMIPSVELGELTELEWIEAEYDENEERENLTWQEKAAATLRLARLRGLQAEAQGLPAPSVADLAVEIQGSSEGRYQDDTRKELIVARHFKDPEIAGAKNLKDAFATLKRREETARRVELAERVGATFTAAVHQLYNADSLVWLPEQAAETYDVILTDPPFGMGADEFGDAGVGAQAHEYDDSPDILFDILRLGLPHLYRIAKPAAHLYWFCDIQWFNEIKSKLETSGWKVHRTPLVWHKPNAFRAPWPEHGPRRTYELIIYAIKGQRPVNLLAGDVITCPLDQGSEGAQKPVALFQDLLRRSVRPGDTVLDPFCGKGSIFPAANALKCAAVGVEKSASEYTRAMERLTKLKGEGK